MTDTVSYGDAAAELEAILVEIEADDVDIDVLSERVSRAAELIRICRDRIRATRMEVEEIVAGLDVADTPGAADAGGGETEAGGSEPDLP